MLPTDNGWIAECPFWGCGHLLVIEPQHDHWHFTCQAEGDHDHDDIVDHLQCDAAISLDAEATRKLWRAVMLSPSLEVCEALLRGEPVPKSALDPFWRRRFGI